MIDREHVHCPCRDPALEARAPGTTRGVARAAPGHAVGESQGRIPRCGPALLSRRRGYRAGGEVTAAALAGESVPCLELLRTWSRRREDPHVLTLASRGPTDPLDIDLDGSDSTTARRAGRPRSRTCGCSRPVAACRTDCRPPPPRPGPGACEPDTPSLGPFGLSLRPLSTDEYSERCARGSASPS
jgi:hypothetical protein